MLQELHRLGVNHDFTLSKTTKEILLEFKRTYDPSARGWKTTASLRQTRLLQGKLFSKTTKTMPIKSRERHLKLNADSINAYAILQKSKIIIAIMKVEGLRA